MKNEDVTSIMKDSQGFWIKWRDNVPDEDSELWEKIYTEFNQIVNKYGYRKVWIPGGREIEKSVALPIIEWFLDELWERRNPK